MTALELITAALRSIGIKQRGYDIDAEESADGLEALNLMIRSWAAQALSIAYHTRESATLSSGANEYSIGSGGTIDTARPLLITDAYLTDTSGSNRHHLSPMSSGEYARLDYVATARPERFYFQPKEPLSTLVFDRTLDQDYTLYLHCLKQMSEFASLSTDDSFPPEYLEALRYNLAVRLAPEYGRSVPNEVGMLATSSLRALKNRALANRMPVVLIGEGLYARDVFDVEYG